MRAPAVLARSTPEHSSGARACVQTAAVAAEEEEEAGVAGRDRLARPMHEHTIARAWEATVRKGQHPQPGGRRRVAPMLPADDSETDRKSVV